MPQTLIHSESRFVTMKSRIRGLALLLGLLLLWPGPALAINLLSAAQQGDLESSIKLHATGASLDQQDGNGNSALMFALRYRHPELAKWLMAHGAALNLKRSGEDEMKNWRALDFAITQGYADLALELLAAGAEVNYQDRSGSSPLHRAVQLGQLPIVQALIEAGAHLNAQRNFDNADMNSGWTPLMYAVESVSYHAQNQAIVLYLLQHGANPYLISGATSDSIERGEETAIDLAARRTSREFIHQMLATETEYLAKQKPASAEALDWTLQYAAIYEDLNLVKNLKALGGELNGEDPVLLTASYPDVSLAFLKALIALGAEPKANRQGQTPLHRAVDREGSLALVSFYLSLKPDLKNAKNAQGQTPLHLAACSSREILTRLLAAKPVLDGLDQKHRSPLWMALNCDQVENVQLLLKAGARWQPNAEADFPLELALRSSPPAMAQALLDAGLRPRNPQERKALIAQMQARLHQTGDPTEQKAWKELLRRL